MLTPAKRHSQRQQQFLIEHGGQAVFGDDLFAVPPHNVLFLTDQHPENVEGLQLTPNCCPGPADTASDVKGTRFWIVGDINEDLQS